MSTFVVRFVGDPAHGYRGTARHVTTGEERVFANLEALVDFFNELNAVRPQESDEGIWEWVRGSPEAPAKRRERR